MATAIHIVLAHPPRTFHTPYLHIRNGHFCTMANYNKLASLMGEHHELAILRNFRRSNTKNLLYMQAEILHLEKEIQVIEVEDQTSKDEYRASLHTSLFNLKESSGSSHAVQWNKILELREKLQAYSKCEVSKVAS